MSWLKQTKENPLFEDLIWSKPENKNLAGKLLIIGGNLHSFNAPSQAFQFATKAGAGTIRLILPVSLKKTVGSFLPECKFAPVTPSGSFNRMSLDTFLESSAWADQVLIAGDLGKNSETAITIESFIDKYSGLLTITKDAVDIIVSAPNCIKKRNQTTLVLTLAQLQKLAINMHFEKVFKFETSAQVFANYLEEFTLKFPLTIVINHLSQIWCGHSGFVSSTKNFEEKKIWRVETASKVAVWQMQNSDKIFEATTTGIL